MNRLSQDNDTVAIVPVRSGSKGLPGKNIMLVDGLPLYMHAVNQALRTVGRVFLSTDIDSIEDVAMPKGCTLCRRPATLAADDTTMESVIRHLIDDRELNGKTLVLLQATSPLRLDEDIMKALDLFGMRQYDMVMSIVERDRAVLKYGTLKGVEFNAMRAQQFCFFNRQNLPAVYGPNGAVYVFDADRFVAANGFPSNSIGTIEMTIERSTDIDSSADLSLVEDILRSRNSGHKRDGG